MVLSVLAIAISAAAAGPALQRSDIDGDAPHLVRIALPRGPRDHPHLAEAAAARAPSLDLERQPVVHRLHERNDGLLRLRHRVQVRDDAADDGLVAGLEWLE